MLFLMGIIAGILLPIQTSVNSKMRFKTGSPYLATTASLVTGTISVVIIGLLMGKAPWMSLSVLGDDHWWLGLGGLMGAFAFTCNIILLPKLGSVQTVIMPLLGQIIMSMLIDNFGWFNLPINRFNLIRLVGVIALLTGVLTVVYQKGRSGRSKRRGQTLLWQLLGIFAGFALAIQTASNGALGKAISSPINASIYSLASGAVIMIVGVGILGRNFDLYRHAIGHGSRWWIWFGGPIGSIYILGSLYLAPILGAGTAIVLTILGNIAGGLVIDKFGLIGTPKRPVGIRQYAGVIVMILGIVLIKLF